jgi:hypothetical protein
MEISIVYGRCGQEHTVRDFVRILMFHFYEWLQLRSDHSIINIVILNNLVMLIGCLYLSRHISKTFLLD